jgi:hypothetical protein
MVVTHQRPHRRVVSGPSAGLRSPGAPPALIIPFDYAASFELTGIPGNVVEGVINISVEGIFVAVAVGYGFEEERGRPTAVTPGADPVPPGDITLSQIPADALISGFRVDPRFETVVFQSSATNGQNGQLTSQPLPAAFLSQVFQSVKPPADLSFLFSMVDTSSGRELQDEPTNNLASLGISNGERPFRLLAQPLSFLPRSTIRLQVIERSQDVQGTLFIVLYGYKILGAAGCSESAWRALLDSHTKAAEGFGGIAERVIPFDYVTKFELSGRPGNTVEDEVTVNVEGGFVTTSLGYGLAVGDQAVPLQAAASGGNGTFDLSQQKLSALPASALRQGFRIRPDFIRFAFRDSGVLSSSLPLALAPRIFESLNQPEDVSFRYTIFDSGTGRELQNLPINNIAGLGIANGKRPFKHLARPMLFQPRSTIRVTVEEHFGRGTLFIVFQGYKVLGPSLAGGRL